MDLMKERDAYLRQIREGSFWQRDQRDEPLWATEQRLDSTDPQPATSEMLCGFVLGCVVSAAVLIVWNWKV